MRQLSLPFAVSRAGRDLRDDFTPRIPRSRAGRTLAVWRHHHIVEDEETRVAPARATRV